MYALRRKLPPTRSASFISSGVTGESDFIVVVVVPTMADYEALTRRLFFGNTM